MLNSENSAVQFLIACSMHKRILQSIKNLTVRRPVGTRLVVLIHTHLPAYGAPKQPDLHCDILSDNSLFFVCMHVNFMAFTH